MKFPFTIAALLSVTFMCLTGCDDPKKWNPPLPGAHEGSSVGDHDRPSPDGAKTAGEPKAPPSSTPESSPPSGQTRPVVPTPPPQTSPPAAPREAAPPPQQQPQPPQSPEKAPGT